MSDQTVAALRQLLTATLNLGARGQALQADTELLGNLPELDSMAVMSIAAALEERFDIEIDDDDISARTFATLGSLAALVERKIPA
ncbi:MAG TPA: phosphopantetheine-binding protein [Burkholderiaceae bacterium]